MILERILNYYGKLGNEEQRYIQENVEKLTVELQNNFATKLFSDYPTGKKIPDVSAISKTLSAIQGKKPKVYMWSKCLECGTEYAYGLPMCPACYKNGLECRAIAVKKSDFQPPMSVIKYNKEYIGDGKEVNCYDCPYKEMSYCQHYGQVDWMCRDYSNCQCASCCVKAKKINESMNKGKQEVHYAVRRAV